MENLPDDEMPKREIWLNPKKISDHFAYIRKRRSDDDREGEAPEGNLDDVAQGAQVTLRNRLVDSLVGAGGYDDFSEF